MRHIKDPTIVAGLLFFALLVAALGFGPRLLDADPGVQVTPVVVIK